MLRRCFSRAMFAALVIGVLGAIQASVASAEDASEGPFPTCTPKDAKNTCFHSLTKADYPSGWKSKKPGSYIEPLGCNRGNSPNFDMEGTIAKKGAKRSVVIPSKELDNLPPLDLYCDFIFAKIVGKIDSEGAGKEAKGVMEAKTGKTQLTAPLMATVTLTQPSETKCEFGSSRAGGPIQAPLSTEGSDGVRYTNKWGMLDLFTDKFKVPGVYTVYGEKWLCDGLLGVFKLFGYPMNIAVSLNPKVPGIKK